MSDEWTVLSEQSAADAQVYLLTMREIASGNSPEAAFPMALLALSQVLVIGRPARRDRGRRAGRAVRARPRPGSRRSTRCARTSPTCSRASTSTPTSSTRCSRPSPRWATSATTWSTSPRRLSHGLSHQAAGRPVEALWWWQFSYLSHWGERAASALRVVQALLAHVRLDADPDAVSEAEFDALHP